MRLSTNGVETEERVQQQRCANILEDTGSCTTQHTHSYKDDTCGPDESTYVLQGTKTHVVDSLEETESTEQHIKHINKT